MTKQFTVSEVRTESCKQGQLHRQTASDMLNAFADLLEAQEKAVPVYQEESSVGWHDITEAEFLRLNTEYKIPPNNRILYTHPSPSDAERLEELGRILRGAVIQGDARVIGKNELKHALEILAAHSAQAQPQNGDWVLVPRDPTHAMRESAASYGGRGGYNKQRGDDAMEVWRDMLAAVPQLPAASATPNLTSYWRIVAEAAEVLQMVLASGVKLPPNWRGPLLDELSGLSAMMLAAQENPNG